MQDDLIRTSNQPVELGRLLANTIGSVVQAQEQLDSYSERRSRTFETAEAGTLTLPPLWYTFSNVVVEMELSATVARLGEDQSPHIMSQTLDPASVGLYGHSASSGLKVRVEMAPQGVVPIKESDPQPETEAP
ncbi:MAG: hypothetical protein P8166_02925 [Candidatus Thiodiazotropha sp.]